MLGAGQRIGGMQRFGSASSRLFQNDADSKIGTSPTRSTGVLPSGESARKPRRLVGEIDIDPPERNALLGQRNHRALHIGTELCD